MRAVHTGCAVLFGLLMSACAPDPFMERVAAGGESVAPTSSEMAQMRDTCPILVPDTQVSYRNTPTGLEVTFITQSQYTEELRDRVDHLASTYQGANRDFLWFPVQATSDAPSFSPDGMMTDDRTRAGQPMSQAQRQAMYHGPMPRAAAQSESVQRGARLQVVAVNPQQVQTLRQHVQMHVQDLQEGRCPMPRRTLAT